MGKVIGMQGWQEASLNTFPHPSVKMSVSLDVTPSFWVDQSAVFNNSQGINAAQFSGLRLVSTAEG